VTNALAYYSKVCISRKISFTIYLANNINVSIATKTSCHSKSAKYAPKTF
jgi:hypothetical protein